MAHTPTSGPAPVRIVKTSDNPPVFTPTDWGLIVLALTGREWRDPTHAKRAHEIIDKIRCVSHARQP